LASATAFTTTATTAAFTTLTTPTASTGTTTLSTGSGRWWHDGLEAFLQFLGAQKTIRIRVHLFELGNAVLQFLDRQFPIFIIVEQVHEDHAHAATTAAAGSTRTTTLASAGTPPFGAFLLSRTTFFTFLSLSLHGHHGTK
jgi:hypothetical protein